MNIKGKLKQIATYWGSPVRGGFPGYTFAAPVLIKCRWEDRNEMFVGQDAQEEVCTAIIYADSDLDLDGFVYLGVSAENLPYDQSGSLQIRARLKSPNIKSTQFMRKYFLSIFKAKSQ